MASSLPRWYVESSIFISLLMEEIEEAHGTPRWVLAEQVFAAGQRGLARLVTSTYTIVEVNGGRSMATDAVLRRQVSTLFRRPYLDLIEVDRRIAESARDLVWTVRQSNLAIKNDDMIHLATAIQEECDVLLTWDEKHLLRLDGRYGIAVRQPQMLDGQRSIPRTT